jgi:hypothetical protein
VSDASKWFDATGRPILDAVAANGSAPQSFHPQTRIEQFEAILSILNAFADALKETNRLDDQRWEVMHNRVQEIERDAHLILKLLPTAELVRAIAIEAARGSVVAKKGIPKTPAKRRKPAR